MTGYLTTAPDSRAIRWAAVVALVIHFVLFAVVLPVSDPDPVRPASRPDVTVIRRFQPPARTSPERKTVRRVVNPVPVPDPTPDEPEPLVVDDASMEIGAPDAEFVVTAPDAVPGPAGARGQAFDIGDGGIVPPVLLQKLTPEYTAAATRRGIQGIVFIRAVITPEGGVVEPILLRGLADPELNERALAAVQQWRFKPGLKDGQPVPVIATFEVTFRLH